MCILKRLAYLEEQLGKHEAAEAHYREVLNGKRERAFFASRRSVFKVDNSRLGSGLTPAGL